MKDNFDHYAWNQKRHLAEGWNDRIGKIEIIYTEPGQGRRLYAVKIDDSVGKRIDNQEAWQMPQGGVDKGENVEVAAKRELYEETGIQSIRIIKKSDKEYIYDLPDHLLGKIWKGK